jgi:hypothetical protein
LNDEITNWSRFIGVLGDSRSILACIWRLDEGLDDTMPVVMDDLSMSEEEALSTRPSRVLCSIVPSSYIFCPRKLSANLAELVILPL